MAKISANAVVGMLVLLAMVSSSFVIVQAAEIQTYNVKSCDGSATNTFLLSGGCQNFNDQSAVQISGISSSTRVSIHNTEGCQSKSQVAQIYGGGCVVQGNTALNSVFIDA